MPCRPAEPRPPLGDAQGEVTGMFVCFWKVRVRLMSKSRPAGHPDAQVFPHFQFAVTYIFTLRSIFFMKQEVPSGRDPAG